MRLPSLRKRPYTVICACVGLAFVLAGTGCGEAPKEAPRATEAPANTPKPKAEDVSRYLSRDAQVSVKLVEDQLLGIAALPGGNIAEYNRNGKRYRQFLLKAPTVAMSAVYLTDVKDAMTNPRFVANFGGYFGEFNKEPIFVFTKNEYLTGFVGLSLEEADAAGRVAAARIP